VRRGQSHLSLTDLSFSLARYRRVRVSSSLSLVYENEIAPGERKTKLLARGYLRTLYLRKFNIRL